MRRGARSPSITWRSVRQVAHAATRTRTSPGPGSGTGRAAATSGAPAMGAWPRSRIARMTRRASLIAWNCPTELHACHSPRRRGRVHRDGGIQRHGGRGGGTGDGRARGMVMKGIGGKVAIIGTGTIKFGENFHQSLTDMIFEAVTLALADARLEPRALQAAWLGCYE